MATIGGNSSVRDGLVFYYDTGNKYRSFKGEPTNNEANTQTSRIFNFYGGSAGTKGDAPEKGVGWKKIIFTSTGTNGRIASLPYISHLAGQTKTYSIEYDLNGNDQYSFKIDGSSGTNGDTNIDDGKRWSGTFTRTTDGTQSIFLNGPTNQTGINHTIYYRNYQVEQKGYPTPFTPNSRPTTESLYDLTGNQLLDVSNVSFDSEGMFFNNQYLTIQRDLRHSWSYECVVRMDKANTFAFLGNGISGTNQGLHIWMTANNRVRFGMYSNDIDGTVDVTVGEYHHFVFTYSHDAPYTKKIYFNGVETPYVYQSGPNQYASTNTTTLIGGTYSSGVAKALGKYPVAKLYDRVISDEEVKRNYNSYKSRFNLN
jgi:hypothetical protein